MVQLFIEGRYEGIEKTSPLFCSGLVALMLKRLGILDQTVPCNAYFPKDLSSLYPGHMNVISGTLSRSLVTTGSGFIRDPSTGYLTFVDP